VFAGCVDGPGPGSFALSEFSVKCAYRFFGIFPFECVPTRLAVSSKLGCCRCYYPSVIFQFFPQSRCLGIAAPLFFPFMIYGTQRVW